MGQAGAGSASEKLFNGYDSIANGMLNESAVTGGSSQSGARSVVNIRVCESVSELARALEIDGSLSVSYLKAVNVTAKMKFMQKLNATARSVSIVVYACHETGIWEAKDVKLKEGIKAPTNDDEAADFVAVYGDSYVSAATQGGEYYAVYTFHTETQTEQKELTASLKAKGVYSGVTAKLDVQTKLTDFVKQTSTNWTFDQEITGIANPSLPDQDKLIEYALAFPSKTLDSAVTTGLKVSGYEGVPGINRRKLAKIVENRDHFLGEDGVLLSYARLTGMQNQINWLKRIYARYNYTGDGDLLNFEKQVKEDLGKINKQVTAYKRDPAADFASPDLPSLLAGEPVLDFAAGQPASFGNEGGGTFDFMSVGDAFRNQVRIVSIRLADGEWDKSQVIRRIEVEYASDKARWTRVHGDGGNGRERFFVEDGQFPAKLRIRHGGLVDALEIWLDDGRSTSAGGGGGAESYWTPGPGAVVLGFAGRAQAALDQLKIIHGALKKARYVKSG
jgi:hypothetical protein